MIPEENEAIALEIIRFQAENPDCWGDQDENGIDLVRLRENLKLTPAQRFDKHEAARQFVVRMAGSIENPKSTQRCDTNL